MRRVVYAASFVDDADAMAAYIETKFGLSRADGFIADIEHLCEVLANLPRIGSANHGFDTPLFGVVFQSNWVFYQINEDEILFVHLVASRRLKSLIQF